MLTTYGTYATAVAWTSMGVDSVARAFSQWTGRRDYDYVMIIKDNDRMYKATVHQNGEIAIQPNNNNLKKLLSKGFVKNGVTH
jgi:hypothetical protein